MRGIQGRLVLLTMAIVIATAVTISTVMVRRYRETALRELDDGAMSVTQLLGGLAEPPLLLNDTEALRQIAKSAADNPDIEVIAILDAQRELVAASASPTVLAAHRIDVLDRTCSKSDEWHTHMIDGHLIAVGPIRRQQESLSLGLLEGQDAASGEGAESPLDERLGSVFVVISLESLHRQVTAFIGSAALLTLIVVVCAVGATVYLTRLITRPMRNLVETSRAIAAGDRSRRATEGSFGEIGTLARAFNHMTDRLEASYRSVEQVVEARTRELVHANRAKSDFLANMSHEIRTPMAAILGFTETMLDPDISEQERSDAVATIHRNGRHLLSIVNDVLDISKIEADKLQLDRAAFDPQSVVEEVRQLMQPRAKQRGLVFRIDHRGPLPQSIKSDPMRLQQILINLVGNAIKFTSDGEVVLAIAHLPATKHQPDRLRFDVIDTGIGITRDQLHEIFQPFTQADETVTRRFGGTGLGLAISKRLAELLDGGIDAASELGRGSTFTLTIATHNAADAKMIEPGVGDQITQAAEPIKRQSRPQPLVGLRVLVAEDGLDNQRLIQLVLRKAGARVTVAENGQLAYDAAQEAWRSGEAFDVILMDMQMPVMDGYTATGRLREAGYSRPIVALTAHAMSTDRKKCIAAGCDEYLTKPIDRPRLIELISELAARSTAGACDATRPATLA